MHDALRSYDAKVYKASIIPHHTLFPMQWYNYILLLYGSHQTYHQV